jgi:transcriptional regulator with XRE-family HTH domain
MNTKLKNEFKKAIQFSNQEDKTEHDSKILMFKFLSIIEDEMALRNMSKKELANQLNTSPSYITQLFRGTKTINLIKLAQLQNLFNIEFEIQLVSKAKTKKKSIRTMKNSKSKSLAVAR